MSFDAMYSLLCGEAVTYVSFQEPNNGINGLGM